MAQRPTEVLEWMASHLRTILSKMRFSHVSLMLISRLGFMKVTVGGVFNVDLSQFFVILKFFLHSTSFHFHLSTPANLASLLVDPPEPQAIGKTQFFETFLPFRAPASSLFRLSPYLIFSVLTFTLSEFLPGCAFLSVHIVGSVASKLPSTRGSFQRWVV